MFVCMPSIVFLLHHHHDGRHLLCDAFQNMTSLQHFHFTGESKKSYAYPKHSEKAERTRTQTHIKLATQQR